MNDNIKIWGTSFSLTGDLVMSLPQLTYFKKKYPNSYVYFVIHKKISYCAPLFFNHPLIDRIRISDEWSEFGSNDYEIAMNCEVLTTSINKQKKFIENRIPVDPDDWWNKRDCIQQNAYMSKIYDLKETLSEDELYPNLIKWFDDGIEIPQKKGAYTYKKILNKENKRLEKAISIWPFAAYGRSQTRSPSVQWWNKLVDKLIKKKIRVFHCGYITEPSVSDNNNYYFKITDQEFLDQIKLSLATNISIGTDSGSMWVLGAYSHNSLCLSTNWAKNHISNLDAFIPRNINGKSIYSQDGCDNIDIEHVIDLIDESIYTKTNSSIISVINKLF